jgi:hypothetical protein
MAWNFSNQSEQRGIGRGEVAESHLEAPFFALFMIVCSIVLFIFHIVVQNNSYTVALTISMVVFGTTIIKVEYGLYILIIAMLLSPEIQAGTVGTHDERGLNLRYDDILIMIIFLGVLVKQAFENHLMIWRSNPINMGIVWYYGVCIISTMIALRVDVPAWDKSVAFFVMLKMLEFYIIFFMVGVVVTNAKIIRHQLILFFGVSLIVCIYAISTIGRFPRVSAPFEVGGTEPNTLGGYLLIVITIAGGLYCYAPKLKYKLMFLAIACTAFAPFLMTLSRASYTALIVSLLVLGVIGRKYSVIALIAIVLVISPFVMPQNVKDRVQYTFKESGVPLEFAGVETTIDKSTYERIYIWEKVRFNLGVWPLFGGGVSWDTVLDSQYARVLIETGIMGFIAYAYLMFMMLKTSRESYLWNRYWVFKGMALGMFATTAGLMVHSLGTISFLIVRIMEPFWFLMALTVVAREIALVDYHQRMEAYQQSQIDKKGTGLPQPLTPDSNPNPA